MRVGLVTVSSDGNRDYVTLPNGERKILGTISILQLITEVTPHLRQARRILDEYLEKGAVMLSADLDKMDALFTPKRPKFSTIALMSDSDRTGREQLLGKTMMKAFLDRLACVETAVEGLSGLTGQPANEVTLKTASTKFESVRKLVGSLEGLLVAQEEQSPAEEQQKEATAPIATPSVDSLQNNASLADEVLASVSATDAKITQLVTAGRKFNASAARSDLYSIVTKVAEILDNVDLAQPWVANDLTALANEASRIHSLFESAKV